MSRGRLEELNTQVSLAVHEAEHGMHQTSGEQRAAFMRLSVLEAEIVDLVPATEVEGAVARRGAVRAAMNAGDKARAMALVDQYVKDGINEELKIQLDALLV